MPEKPQDDLTDAIQQHTDVLLAAAWSLGWSGTDAEELVQETFVTFLKISDRFEGRSSLRTFLFGILYNKAREMRRDNARELTTDPIDAAFEGHFGSFGIWTTFPKGPEDEALAQETALLVEDCVQHLPLQQKMAFFLREIEQGSTKSICNILDLSVTHLGVVLHRARNKVRDCVEKKWKESGL